MFASRLRCWKIGTDLPFARISTFLFLVVGVVWMAWFDLGFSSFPRMKALIA
jgi:hypothetical protein